MQKEKMKTEQDHAEGKPSSKHLTKLKQEML
jgi:hypothetical protein